MNWKSNSAKRPAARGFSMIEMCIGLTISLVMMGIAIPIVGQTVSRYRLSGAVASLTGAIRTTRYQALMRGYPYRLAINPTTRIYQLSSDPERDGTFVNVGSAIPFTGRNAQVTVSASTTLQFRPNGQVSATTGALNFNVSYQGVTKAVTVTTYGNVTVSQ